MELSIYSKYGADTGEVVDIDSSLYENIDINKHNVYLTLKAEMNNKRKGTHSTKDRSEKRGGGKKPFPQKGRGAARHGSIRSPLWVGGGVTFGPKPKEYDMKVNKKIKRDARKSLLAEKLKNEDIIIIEDFDFGEIKSRNVREMLEGVDRKEEKILLAANNLNKEIYLSARNFPNINLTDIDTMSSYDIIDSDVILVDKQGIQSIMKILREE